jgi:ubiquinol-cytochrome c reductase cytochrome c subunit
MSTSRTNLRALAGWLAVLTAGLGLAAITGGSATAQPEQGETTSDIQGADIYTSRCANCHGASGQGGTTATGVRAPRLRRVPIALVDLVVRTRRMPPGDADADTRTPNPVRGERRVALLRWMRANLALTGELPAADLDGGDPARGQEVYAANCQQCHGSTGAGGVAGAGAFTPGLIHRQPIVIAEAIRLGPFQMPQFGEDVVSDEEIRDVVAFLDEVGAEDGTPLGIAELNPVFAAAYVFVFALAALLSAMWLSGRVAMFPDAPPAEPGADGPPSREAAP